jgi:photosystem II stability/assembly factor-like uncharacterized protein
MKYVFLILFVCSGIFGLRAQWQPTNGPDGGGGYGIVKLGSRLFASTFSGVYISDDNGDSWRLGGLRGSEIFRILPFSGAIYATTRDTLYRSSDGSAWEYVTSFGAEQITSLAEHDGGLYLSVWETFDSLVGGIYRTLNGGTSFERMTNTMNFTSVRALVSSGTTLIACTYRNGISRSTDHGLNWLPSNNGVPTGPIIQSAHMSGNTIYVAGNNLFIRSTNDGGSWQSPSNIGLPSSGIQMYDFSAESNTILASMNISDTMMISNDGGDHWQKLLTTSLPYLNSYYSFSKIGNETYVQCDAGFYSTTNNGSNWTQKNKGVRTLSVNSLLSYQGYIFAHAAGVKLYGSNDGGTAWDPPSWLQLDANEQIRGFFIFFDIDIALLCMYGSNLRSYSGTSLNGNTAISPSFSAPTSFKDNIYAFEDTALVSFGSIDAYNTRSIQNFPFLRSASIYPRAEDIMMFGDGAFVTSAFVIDMQAGSSWSTRDTINGVSNATGFVDLHSSYFVGFKYGGIYKSINGGYSWSRLPAISGSAEVYALTSVGKYLFASINDINSGLVGLYSSFDDGATWNFAGEGLPECYSIAVHSDGYMYAGTSEGVYRRPMSELAVHEQAISLDNITIYPNPASEYIMAGPGVSHIALYSLLGEKIFERDVRKSTRVELPHLAKGMYIFKAAKGDEILTSKLLIE